MVHTKKAWKKQRERERGGERERESEREREIEIEREREREREREKSRQKQTTSCYLHRSEARRIQLCHECSNTEKYSTLSLLKTQNLTNQGDHNIDFLVL